MARIRQFPHLCNNRIPCNRPLLLGYTLVQADTAHKWLEIVTVHTCCVCSTTKNVMIGNRIKDNAHITIACAHVGDAVGPSVGALVGSLLMLGMSLGCIDGWSLGAFEGDSVGWLDGRPVGW